MKRIGPASCVAVSLLLFATGRCDVHYVSTRGSNEAPYVTQETAAHGIQDAIDAASRGDRVLVGPGTYREPVEVKEGVELLGAGAAETTILGSLGVSGRMWYGQPTAKIMSGGSIQGFRVVGAGFAAVEVKGAESILDCVITGPGFGIYGSGSDTLIAYCLITGTYCGIWLNGGSLMVVHCTISNNSVGIRQAPKNMLIVKSIIWGNAADFLDGLPSSANLLYSDVGDDGFAGTNGNISADPQFLAWADFNRTDNPIHVDAAHEGPEQGTESNPFRSIGAALSHFSYRLTRHSPCRTLDVGCIGYYSLYRDVAEGPAGATEARVRVHPGAYEERALCLPRGTILEGSGPDRTVIVGAGDATIVAADDCSIRCVRITGAGVSFGDVTGCSMTECLVTGNPGFGVASLRSDPLIRNCTILGNYLGSVSLSESPLARIQNCILAGISAPFCPDQVSHSDILDPYFQLQDGNISADPMFIAWGNYDNRENQIYVDVRHAGPEKGTPDEPFRTIEQALRTHRYRPAVGSPCLNSGDDGKHMGCYPDDIADQCPSSNIARINVAPGRYPEGVILVPGDVELIGSGMDSTAIELSHTAVMFWGTSITLEGFNITGGLVGVLCYQQSAGVIRRCRLAGNRQSGIQQAPSVVIDQCDISQNGYAGVGQACGTISNSALCDNGSFGIDAQSQHTAFISRSRIGRNGWSGILCDAGAIVLSNSLLFDNREAGVSIVDSITGANHILNSTVWGLQGPGIQVEFTLECSVSNSIVGATSGPAITCDGLSSVAVSYCDVQGGYPGEGNIDADPRFIDASNEDFRLLPDSPCIDAGFNSADLPDSDIAGMHRIMFGGKSLTVDMGAYEFYINTLTPGPEPQATTFTWSSLADKTYSIFYTDDLLNWQIAIANFPSLGNQTTSWLDDGSITGLPPLLAPKRFYRVLANP